LNSIQFNSNQFKLKSNQFHSIQFKSFIDFRDRWTLSVSEQRRRMAASPARKGCAFAAISQECRRGRQLQRLPVHLPGGWLLPM